MHIGTMSPANLPPRWHAVALQKKKEQTDRVRDWRLDNLPAPDVTNYLDFPQRCGLLTEEELRITEKYDATALAQAIREGSLKCVDVTRAFCKVRERYTSNSSCGA
jgi:amidase